jgi:vancomycin resistance protein VanJ
LKKLSFFGKILFWCNSIVAVLLLVSFILPYLAPKQFPSLSLLSLGVSPLIVLTFLFGVYWLVKLKKQFILSAVMLVAAYLFFNPFYKFPSNELFSSSENTISVLSYNVRLFNAYQKDIDRAKISDVFDSTLKTAKPDVIFIQEYYRKTTQKISGYPYQYIYFKNKKIGLGYAIFSKYPLINTGSFDFEKSYNNSLRLYNVHLKSLGITASVNSLQEQDKEQLFNRTGARFERQQDQVEILLSHIRASKHPVILGGDFNNTAFSYVYRKLLSGMKDAFIEKGSGLGTTFMFDFYPMRIDYIFGSKQLEVLEFTSLDQTFSDHFPIAAVFGLPK